MTTFGSSHPQANPVVLSDESGQLLRPARALVGWMPDEMAFRLLGSQQAGFTPSDAHRERVATARFMVAERGAGLDQTDVVTSWPDELVDHETALREAAAPMFAEGWSLRLVDLSRVAAFQPVVFTDHAMERASGVDGASLGALANLTVPVTVDAPLRASFDESKNAWVLVSANPNLRLLGHFSGPLEGAPPGAQSFGFLAGTLPSRLQVAEFQGRHYLRDGYHRSIGLLASGVKTVPAFVRSFANIEEVVPPSMLPQAAYIGPRPPRLPDYLDDQVAADVRLPVSQKMVMVQGLELGFLA